LPPGFFYLYISFYFGKT